ncbi:MAG: hypothetical protein WC346_04750 [Methanogenium sp.]|jgi:hypothetical protein
MSIQDYFDKLPTWVRIYNQPLPGEKKHKVYFGCNDENIPTVIIKWCEKGRGFGEYAFQFVDGKMYCDSEGDKRETVKKILNIMVDQCIFVDELREE